MNLKFTLFILATFFLSLFQANAKETIIKGKITGKLPAEIRYTAPVNGSLGFDVYYTSKPNAQGDFILKIDLKEIAVIDLYYNLTAVGFVIATPGTNYNVIIDRDNNEMPFSVEGKDTEVQKLYNGFGINHRMVAIDDFAMSMRGKSAVEVEQYISTKKAADIAAFEALFKSKAITQDVYNYMKTERNYFYAVITGYTAGLMHHFSFRKPIPDLDVFDEQWTNVYKAFPVNGNDISKSPWGHLYLAGYLNYKKYEAAGFDIKKLEPNDLITGIQSAEEYLPANNLEFYIGGLIHQSSFGGTAEKSLLFVYNDFKQKYPNSGYTKYLEKDIAPVVEFHKTSTNITGATAFVDDYRNINSLNELIQKFSGKKLYFDVWATGCAPCREEFKHKEGLYKLLAEQGVTIVYISTDDEKREDQWKKMINFYGLEGLHIRANKQLYTDLRKVLDKNGAMIIPWYMLVSKDGKLSPKHASPPSDIDRLKNEIIAM